MALTAVGAMLRLHEIGEESLWNDEFASMEDALALGPDVLIEQLGYARPLYYVLLRPWIEVFGTTETGMRLLSAILGIAAIPAIYYLGVRTYGRRAGFFGALLLTFSRFHVRWSQDVRMYALFALLAILSYLAFARYLDGEERWGRGAYVGVTVLLAYTHLFAAFVIVAQNVYVALAELGDRWHRLPDGSNGWIKTQLAIGMLTLPVIVSVPHRYLSRTGDGGDVVGWIPSTGLYEVVTIPAQQVYRTYDPLLPVLIAIGIAIVVVAEIVTDDAGRRWTTMWTICLGTVTVVPFLISHVTQPILVLRYTIASLPAVALVVGRSLENVQRSIDGRFVQRLFVVGLVVLLVPPLVTYYEEPQRTQWRETADFVESRATDGDVVLVSPPYTRRNFAHYFTHDAVPTRGVGRNATRRGLPDSVGRADTIWLVGSQNMAFSELRRVLTAINASAAPDGVDETEQDRHVVKSSFVRSFHNTAIYRFETS